MPTTLGLPLLTFQLKLYFLQFVHQSEYVQCSHRGGIGFRAAKQRLLKALAAGDIQHEPREALAEKTLLAIADISSEQVAALIRSCTGAHYASSPHHMDAATEVHEFLPGRGQPAGRERWYIKVYFRGSAWFISVHRSGN